MLRSLFLVLSLLCFRSQAEQPVPVSVEIADLSDVKHVLPAKDKKATVIIFITHDCPIANGYAPEINRICKEYSAREVAFLLAHVDPALSPEAARKHAADYGFAGPVAIDAKHALVALTHATVTPEAAVLTPDGKLAYRGRIDDLYVDYGKKRISPTQRELRETLDALLAGKPAPRPAAPAIGCYIPKLKDDKGEKR